MNNFEGAGGPRLKDVPVIEHGSSEIHVSVNGVLVN